ncbi:MAG TPA: hypothetical protein VH309_01140 [Elusimicrobiota bacterium]|nr:hypothetical protein [Elusimicrobiota bacterium]
MNEPADFREFIAALNARAVEFVIIDAFALAYHGRPQDLADIEALEAK